jgi:hypothetical protein
MRVGGGIVRALAVAAMLLCLSVPALAEPTDTAVKAAFLPRFARYVTWPPAGMPRGADPFQLCVIGGDPFGVMLEDAAGSQLVDGRRIAVRRMDSAAGVDSCQIVFASGSRAGQVIAAIGRRPVLTVTDSASGGQRGIIHFAVVGGHVRFFIDQSAAAQHGLGISSRLLALAVGVRQ